MAISIWAAMLQINPGINTAVLWPCTLILSYFHSNRPVDVKRGNATQAKTTARYPVRSGPKQFASYLNDMGSLILEILSGAMMVSVGTAEIPGLGQLSPTRSIVGFFPIVSPTDEKIGDLHVALVIESLMGRQFFCLIP